MTAVWSERYPAPLAAPTCALFRARGDAAARWCAHQVQRPNLVYLDPPFAVGRVFDWQLESADRTWRHPAYDDRIPDGIDGYLASLEPLLQATRDALDPEGNLLLHCDHRASHWLAVACDRLFGPGDRLPGPTRPGFRNELIWTYGLGGSSPRFWPRKHDTILWYSRGTHWFFDAPRVPATSARLRGQTKKATDVLDVPNINNMAHERTGYPTQKPLELLRMLLAAHCPPDGLVADFCCGSGTTGVAATMLGRAAVLSDLSHDAIAFARLRLLEAGAALRVAALDDAGNPTPLGAIDGHAPSPDVPAVFAAAGALSSDGVLQVSAWRGHLQASQADDVRGWARQQTEPCTTLSVFFADGRHWYGPAAAL